MPSELMTASRYRAWHRCPRYHHYAYELRWRAWRSSPAARFGTLMHAALETWWLCWRTGEAGQAALDEALTAIGHAVAALDVEVDPFVQETLEALLVGYHARWAPEMSKTEVLHVEHCFRRPLEGTPGWGIGGKMDVIIRRRGRVYVVEHKTTSSDLAPGSAYWVKLRMDPQISIYHDGAQELGHDVEGCIYDVIRKPTIRPYQATPPEKRKYRKDGKLYANQRERDETPEEYRDRLVDDVADHPEAYYQRAEVVRLDHELDDARSDIHATACIISASSRAEEMSPRNPDACFRFNAPCDYLDVCSGAARIDTDHRFVQIGPHPELAEESRP